MSRHSQTPLATQPGQRSHSSPPKQPGRQALDRELNLRAIVIFALSLTAIVVAMAGLMWSLSGFLKTRLAAEDPAPAVLPAARTQPLPPGPRLQTEPEQDLLELRAEEEELLLTYSWVDREARIARIPIDRAIGLLVAEEKGKTQ